MGQYGRIGKRRSSGTWLWMVLGFFPGILCGGALVFAMFASGALNSLTTASLPTQTAMVIIATNPPTNTPAATATVAVTETATETATTQAASAGPVGTADTGQMLFPTPTTASLQLVTSTTPQSGVTPLAQSTSIGGSNSAASVEETLSAETTVGVNIQSALPEATTTSPELANLIALQSEMATIPGATFTMGTTLQELGVAVDDCVNRDGGNCNIAYGEDSLPQFQVQLDAYRIETTEVTFEQYLAFLTYLRSIGKSHKDACPSPNGASQLCIQTTNEVPGTGEAGSGAAFVFGGASYNLDPALLQYPVYGVTWAGAQVYCEALGRRLPTEAEWEYAAKGSDPGRLYPWGNIWSEANAKTRMPRDIPQGMVAVRSYPAAVTPGTLLYDMAGNVEEWVSDWYSPDYYTEMSNQEQPVQNPKGPQTAIQKVLRGGSWDALPFFARTVHRRADFPAPDGNGAAFSRSIGFRCADDVEENAPVSNGNPDPSLLGSSVPTATPATANAGAEGTAQPGTGKQG